VSIRDFFQKHKKKSNPTVCVFNSASFICICKQAGVGHSQISAHHISAETGRIFTSMFISLSNSDWGAVLTLNPTHTRAAMLQSVLWISFVFYIHTSFSMYCKKRLVYLCLLNSALFPNPLSLPLLFYLCPSLFYRNVLFWFFVL